MFDFEALTYTVVITDSDDDPVSHSRVMASSDANLWLNAMDTEIHSMYSPGVWALVAPPEGIKPVGLSWIYLKSGLDGNVEMLRARLVAMSYALKEGIIFYVTFSRVAMLITIRILLSISTALIYEI